MQSYTPISTFSNDVEIRNVHGRVLFMAVPISIEDAMPLLNRLPTGIYITTSPLNEDVPGLEVVGSVGNVFVLGAQRPKLPIL